MHYFEFCFFFFNDTATTEIYTLSLHDALPICNLARALDRQGITYPNAQDNDHRTWDAYSIRYWPSFVLRSEEHTSELQSQSNLVCRLLLEKKKQSSTSMRKSSTASAFSFYITV